MGIDIAVPPAIVIEIDGGETWRYGASGIEGLYVKGGIAYSSDRYFFWFDDIQAIHNAIADRILSLSAINGQHFRFLRKELSKTIRDFPGLNPMDLLAWEAGDQTTVESAETIIREEYAKWRSAQVALELAA